MNLTGTAPVRQPMPELPEKEFPGPSPRPETRESSQKVVASLSLLWEQRLLLFRVSIYSLLASTLAAFLIPARYESTARLMPPDNESVSSLAMAAAAMSGAAGWIGGLSGEFLGLNN